MIKKIFILFILFIFSISLFSQNKYIKFDGKDYNIETIEGQISLLLAKHEKFLREIVSSFRITDFEKSFFTNLDFINDINTKNFFNNLQKKFINRDASRNGSVMMISYTSYSNINGKISSINYEYKASGDKIHLIKQTFNDGKLLKAVYEYDVSGKLLNAHEYRDNKLINKKSHNVI